MDEKWSDFGNPGNNYMANEGIDNLFDGSFSTWMAPQIGGPILLKSISPPLTLLTQDRVSAREDWWGYW